MVATDLRFPQQISQDAGCVKEVIQHLKAEASLESQAEIPKGVADKGVRTVTENDEP